jgi:LysM repeat protein
MHDLGCRAHRVRRTTWWLGTVLSTLLLASCGLGSDSEPTPTPDDVLAIVTPTPGTPPPRTAEPAVARRYVVQEGDSLSGIAARFDVSEAAIQEANAITDPNSIFAGQELIIPAPEP